MSSPQKILIVEDDLLSGKVLARRLKLRGYTIVMASDGKQGVDMARSARPDLILMDLNMPVMDGWTATRTIKSLDETCAIPVVALTAHALVGDREKALEAGCDEYETKPVELQRLEAKMQKLLSERAAAP